MLWPNSKLQSKAGCEHVAFLKWKSIKLKYIHKRYSQYSATMQQDIEALQVVDKTQTLGKSAL